MYSVIPTNTKSPYLPQEDVIDAADKIESNNNIENTTSVKKTRQNKQRNFCYFCEDFVTNFPRHLQRNHKSETEVIKIFSMDASNTERKTLLTKLRKRGNYLMSNQKNIKPVKKPNLPQSKLLPCSYCLGYYSAKQLWRHQKHCPENNTRASSKAQADGQNLLVKHLRIDEELREKVFPRMRADEISLTAKKDTLICAFASRYIKTHREKHFISVTSRKMRELAKILIEVKKMQPSITSLFNALQPQYYDLFVEATKVVAAYDSQIELFKSPTYAMNIATSLKQCCDIAIINALKRKETFEIDDSIYTEKNLKTMIHLLESNWKFDISSQAAANLNSQRWNKITLVPLASDLKILKEFLTEKANQAALALQRNFENRKAYIELLETIFCRVLLLNRRRPGELERLPLYLYEKSEVNKMQNYEEFGEVVSTAEKVLMKRFKRIVITGKRRRGVPVLFCSVVQEHIKILLQARLNFLPKSNIYLFGRPGLDTPISGYKVMEKYANACGAKNPKALTSTRLRKHLATITQLLNMTESDIEQLATFMGHTIGTHRKSYRLPDDVHQTAKTTFANGRRK